MDGAVKDHEERDEFLGAPRWSELDERHRKQQRSGQHCARCAKPAGGYFATLCECPSCKGPR
jgi:hypothetical protein